MPTYISNQPAGACIVEPKFRLKQAGSAGPASLQPPELGFVLDRSASMQSLVNEALTGFNTLVDEQRTVTPPASFSLQLFNDTTHLLYDALPIAQVPVLTHALYEPSGGTALNDAI